MWTGTLMKMFEIFWLPSFYYTQQVSCVFCYAKLCYDTWKMHVKQNEAFYKKKSTQMKGFWEVIICSYAIQPNVVYSISNKNILLFYIYCFYNYKYIKIGIETECIFILFIISLSKRFSYTYFKSFFMYIWK